MDILDLDGGIFDFDNEPLDLDSDALNNPTTEEYLLIHATEPVHNISFCGTDNSDGFIYEGSISLERTISNTSDTFPHYTKDGHDYVKVGSRYICVDKGNTVTINNIKYDTI